MHQTSITFLAPALVRPPDLPVTQPQLLGRFSKAARLHEAQTVVRVCADNPFVAPEEIDRLADAYRAALATGANPDTLYMFNHIPSRGNRYPDGLGAEIFSAALLHRMARETAVPAHREHANEFILDHPALFDIRTLPAPEDIAGPYIRLDVDTPDDLARMRRLCARVSPFSNPADIVSAFHAEFVE